MELIKKIDLEINSEILLKEFEIAIDHKMKDKVNPKVDTVIQKYFILKHNKNWNNSILNMPYTHDLCKEISEIYDYNRIIYRALRQCSCYRWHTDEDPARGNGECYQIPIQTAKGCFFVYENINYEMEENNLYHIKNDVYHTFVNASDVTRIHLAFEKIPDEYILKEF